jgi:hypothetical protein
VLFNQGLSLETCASPDNLMARARCKVREVFAAPLKANISIHKYPHVMEEFSNNKNYNREATDKMHGRRRLTASSMARFF